MTAFFQPGAPALAASPGRPMVRTSAFPLVGTKRNPIAALFAQGANGLWLDTLPTYLFEDSAGTISDVVNGDPTGLALDRHAGLTLGPELVVGGDFSNGIPEVITPHPDASIEVENGRLKITLVGDNYGSIYIKNSSLGAGVYLVEFDYETKDTTGQGYSVRCPDTGGDYNVSLPTNTVGHFSGVITNPTDNQEIYIRGDGPTGPWFVDNISVRELPGNHATQPTSADRPTYGTDGTLHWLAGDGVSDHLLILDNAPKTHPYAAIGNQCSGFFAVQFDQFNPADTTGNWVISSVIHEIRNLGSTDVHAPFSIGANGDKIAFGCTSNYVIGSTKVNGSTALTAGQKYVIGFVVDGTNLSLYLNGQVDAASASLGTASRAPVDGTGNVSSRMLLRTKDDNTTANPLDGRLIGGVVVGYVMSQQQVDGVNAELAEKAGVTL